MGARSYNLYPGDSTVNATVGSEQNKWAFGQWFPVILISLPIFSVSQNWYGE